MYESLKNHIHNNVSIMKNVDCFVYDAYSRASHTHARTHKNTIQNIENEVL